MSVEELVKRLRHSDEYEPLGHDGWEAADKLEELAAENERLKREAEAHYDAGHYRAMSEHATPQRIRADKAEDALAEAKRENEVLKKALKKDSHSVWWRDYYEWLEARNAGGKDA